MNVAAIFDNIFSVHHVKADAREKQRDRTVKNPSEAFNLLLQQNFISTLIFFMREKGRQKCDRFYTIETNISCFLCLPFGHFFFATMETLSLTPGKETEAAKR